MNRGFGYIAMLFFVAISAAALAALGQSWSMASQRERERELEFRGSEIARAIESYVAATPAGQPPQYPESLDDLLRDQRQLVVRHHLRRAYRDPFAPLSEWVLMPPADGRPGFAGVRSAAQMPLLKQVLRNGQAVERVDEWIFTANLLLPGR